jgi:hypothetical protein
MKRYLIVFFLFACLSVSAQIPRLSSISSTYTDDLTEWELYMPDPDFEQADSLERDETEEPEEVFAGRMTIMWPMKEDRLRDWQYEIDGNRGTIRQKWSNDKTHWELSDFETRITMQPTYPGDVQNWRITDNTHTVTLRCRYGNIADEWIVDDSRYGIFHMYTLREGDPRDWVIKNELSDEISAGMSMSLIFIVMFFSQ